MRGLVTFLAALAVIALGYWAYHQNIQTQTAIRQIDRLQMAIGVERERLSVLRAEWAYLNRPDRLRDLVSLNFGRLGLVPIAPTQFGRLDQVAYPRPEPLLDMLLGPVDVAGTLSGQEEQQP